MSGLVVLTILGGGCNRQSSQRYAPPPLPRGQTLRVAAFPDYLAKGTLENFQGMTGNKVVVETYRTNEELADRLAKGTRYDVIFPSSHLAERMIRQGQLLSMQRERIPNLVNVPMVFRNPPFDPGMEHCIPFVWTLLGIGLVNQRDAKGREPDRFSMLFDTKPIADNVPLAKVVMVDDMRATLGAALRSLGYSASTQKAEEIHAAERRLVDQMPRVHDYVEDPAQSLSRGEVTLAVGWSTEIYDLMRRRQDIRFVLPLEGTLLFIDHACVLKGAEHPEVAFAFLNHLLDPFVAAEITNSTMLATANTEARKMLETEARWMWGTFDSVTSRSRTYEIVRDVGPAQPLYDEAWRNVKAALQARRTPRPPTASSPP